MTPQEKKDLETVKNLLAKIISSDRYYFERHLQLADGKNIQLPKGTGTMIGTASNQKLAFLGATPVIRQTSTGVSSGFAAGGGTAVTHLSTFTGNIGSAGYTIGDVVAILKTI